MKFVEVRRNFISPEMREYILKRDKHSCRYCGVKNVPFHLDHVYPASKGGETSYKNLVTSCVSCNLWKHDKIGVYPKPIGYFDDKISVWAFRKYSSGLVCMVSLFLIVLGIFDGIEGKTTLSILEISWSAVIVFPLFLDRLIKDFRSFWSNQ